MGLEGLNPLRKTAEHLLPGADLLYYFREPVTGARPLTEFEAPGYTGTVVWQPEDGSLTRGFAAGTAYTAVVTLSADTDGGFAFNVPAAPEPGSFSHSRSAGVSHDAGTGATLVITVVFAATGSESGGSPSGASEVLDYNLQRYVPVPVAGEAPVALKQPDLALSVDWKDQDGAGIPGLDRFEEGVQYRAIIHITAQGNWTFVKGYPFAYPPGAVESQEDILASVSETMRVVSVVYQATEAPKTVTDLDLSGHISAPVTGATAMRSPVPGKENQYMGSVAWEVQDPDTEKWETMTGAVFQAERIYRAVVTLYAGPGWVFDPEAGVSYTGQTVSWSDEAGKTKNVLDGLLISFPATEKEPVTDLSLTDKVPQPVNGGTPVTYGSAPQYGGTVAWSPDPSGGLFGANTAYTATVTLTAASGYTLEGVGANGFTYTFSGAGGTITYDPATKTAVIGFPQTTDVPVKPVTDLTLTGKLSAPVNGGTPATYFSTPQYTGSVAWDPALPKGLFGPGTAYTATVTLTAASGYTFAGVGANAFTHGGGTASNGAGSGVVTIGFPATAAMPVTDLDLTPYLPAPVVGEPAVGKLFPEPPQYTGTVTWTRKKGDGAEEAHSGAFKAGTIYKATIALTAASGYTFAKDTRFVYAKETISSANDAGKNITVSIGGLSETSPYPW
jgi:hypothetical protein